jgi:hypothetical protein
MLKVDRTRSWVPWRWQAVAVWVGMIGIGVVGWYLIALGIMYVVKYARGH